MDKPTGFTFGSPAAKPVVGFGAPAAQTTGAAAAPATGFSFGSPATAAGTTPAPTLSFGLGGSAAPAASLAPAATTAAPTLSFGGFGLSKPAAPAATTTSAAPAAAAPAFGGFSGFGTATTSTPAAATSITLTSTSAAPVSTLTLGAPAATTTSAPALTLTSSATSNPLTNLTTTTTTTQSSAASTQPAGAQLNFCQLEEHINKWTLELEEQEKIFTNQATQINAWDRVLLENSDKIVALNDSFAKVKTEQKALEQELEYIAAQHAELDECIKPLEKEMARSQQFDPEREQTYLMAESLDTQMKQMGEDLKEVIEHLNEANRDRDPNDPIVQIGKILNAHMSSLQWIENSTSHITAKLENISKLQETLRRDNERSFRVNI